MNRVSGLIFTFAGAGPSPALPCGMSVPHATRKALKLLTARESAKSNGKRERRLKGCSSYVESCRLVPPWTTTACSSIGVSRFFILTFTGIAEPSG